MHLQIDAECRLLSDLVENVNLLEIQLMSTTVSVLGPRLNVLNSSLWNMNRQSRPQRKTLGNHLPCPIVVVQQDYFWTSIVFPRLHELTIYL